MPYLIDGNNLLWCVKEDASQTTRNQLTSLLCEFARKKGCRVIVVYDGEPERVLPGNTQHLGRVLAIFSGTGRSADAALKEIILRENRSDIILVSSDRELQEFSAKCGSEVIQSQLFLTMLRSYTETSTSENQSSDALSPHEIREWIAYFEEEGRHSMPPDSKKAT